MKPKAIAILELSLLALFIALFLSFSRLASLPPENPLVTVGTTTTMVPSFPDTPIEAQSAYVYDVKEGRALYEKQPDLVRPLASITKLMSALEVSALVPSYVQIRISPDDVRQDGDTGLYVGETWDAAKLLDFSLVTSSNDGVHALALAAGGQLSSTTSDPMARFVGAMNEDAKKLGLDEMSFQNPTGLDLSKDVSGAYGSAKDVTMLVDYILSHDPHIIEATSQPSIDVASDTHEHRGVNTDLAIPRIPNVIGSKTGYTDLSGGNVVVAFNAGLSHPIIVTVLGSSYDGRFVDLEALVKSTLQYLANRQELAQKANK